MRKLTAGNKKSFVTFSIIVIGIIAILIWCLITALKVEKEEYVLESGNFLYDKENNPIFSNSSGVIKMKWNGSYYYKEDNSEEEFELGEQTIAYHKNSKTINLFGEMYRVFVDGSVSKITKNNVINKISEDQLYKLADRKYLIVGNSITNESGSLSTSGYLLIVIDKAGNTYLSNNELNSRTLKPIKIYTQTFTLDVANEKLIYDEKEIDLKKIIGSTNNYVEPVEKVETNTTNGDTIIQNNSQTTTNNNEQTINNQNSTIIQNQQSTTTNLGVAESNNNGKDKTTLTKSVSLRGAYAGSTYIDIEYNINDPENAYQTVYVLIDGNDGTTRTVALDKDANSYRVTNLEPNKEYKITLASKALDDEGNPLETIEDITNARTSKINSSLDITKLTLSQIHYKLMLDSNQNIDKAEMVLYINSEEKSRVDVDIDKAMSATGWESFFAATYYTNSNIIIRLENAEFNGQKLNLNLETKARIY